MSCTDHLDFYMDTFDFLAISRAGSQIQCDVDYLMNDIFY